LEHQAAFSGVIPFSGYKLQGIGSWSRAESYDNEWARSLPDQAHAAGQVYAPAVGVTQAALQAVLGNRDVWSAAADNLLALMDDWDAVVYDALDTPAELTDANGDFVLALSTAVRQAGKPFWLSVCGTNWDDPMSFPLPVAEQAADLLIYYCYGWWVQPRMVSPYWWVKQSIDFALTQGLVPSRTVLGCALYSTWWETHGGVRHDMTHAQAVEIAHAHNARVEWLENSASGLVRERVADTGTGYIALTDGSTLRHRLDLAREYELRGAMLFTPGLESQDVWG
jgi:spore germination protein YaaH